MDNITHSLIGASIGLAVSRRFRVEPRKAVWVSVLANNIPDSDFLCPGVLFDGTLGYLLHHRGHTHTLIGASPLGLAISALLIWRKGVVRREWLPLILLGLGGGLLHIFADAWNNYGVHPFWPWNNDWLYGDFVFIIEPWLWIFLTNYVLIHTQQKWWKRLLWVFLALIPLLVWATLPPLWALSILVPGLLFTFVCQRFSKSILPAALTLLLLGVFALGSRRAKHEVQELTAGLQAGEVHEVVIHPYPANPFCWRVISIRKSAEAYSAWMGDLSLWPELVHPESCQMRLRNERTVQLEPLLSETHSVRWIGQFQIPISFLTSEAAKNCQVEAFLQFARAPFVLSTAEGNWWGDLRYDMEAGAGFAELLIKDSPNCDFSKAPWKAPLFRTRF